MQNKFSAMRNLSKNSFLGKKKKSSIEGYVERIDKDEIHGWVISHEQEALNLTLSIAGVSYQVPYSWHKRIDVEANFGKEFNESGFTIQVPASVINAFLSACKDGTPIDVLANDVVLVNGVKPSRSEVVETPSANTGNFKITPSVTAPIESVDKLIEGYVEYIDNNEIQGWVINHDKKNVSLSLSINDVSYPVTPIWHDRKDVAESFGDDFIISGFTVEIPDKLAKKFLLACQNDPVTDDEEYAEKFSAIDIIANGIALPKKLKKKTIIKGNIEYIDGLEISGWVINLDKKEINLSLSINDAVYPVEASWHERPDVAESFGSDFWVSGFTVAIPDKLVKKFKCACQPDEADEDADEVNIDKFILINIIANDQPLTKRLKKKQVIKGHVESINNLEIRGWAIHLEKKDINLALSIDGAAYPVTPVWHDRPDVAANFGNDFIKSGFTVEVPDVVVDTFMLVCQQDKTAVDEDEDDDTKPDRPISIDIIVNGEPLHNTHKQPENLAIELLPVNFKFASIVALNARHGIYISSKEFHGLLCGRATFPLRISSNDSINAHYYLELARQKLISHNIGEARSLLKICLAFEKGAEFLELLGNTYLEQKDYETAAAYYQEAIASKDGAISKWLFNNLEQCKKASSSPKSIVKAAINYIERNPELNFLYERLDHLIQEYWLKQQGRLEVLAVENNREALIAKMAEISGFIYTTYLRAYGAAENPQWLGSCNVQRILIVGDMHIPQCIRYRIDQKIEQLELADKEVTAISWTDLANEQNTLAFYDVVIFYRVPAEPQVLKAMAQVNATGKLSLYEIDDLLFDASYPPPIETYGGYLDLNLYIQILKGMASFNAAARYCRFGIASTQPLADKLEALVFSKRCFVHRNGIDSLNVIKQKSAGLAKATVDIFYGSGTMAHNSDFNDLALPAIARILDEYSHAGLMIAGYLKLPGDFLKRYAGRVKQMPPVKNIKTYWSLLERADINLAVLHDDEINGCKSELKWFEAACLGIPSVMSSTANYRDVIHQGDDGLMAITSEDWYQHLKTLVDDPDLRTQMAVNALSRVQSEYTIEALSRNITDVLNQALSAAQVAEYANRKKIALVNVFFPPQSIGGATRVVSDNFDLLQRDYRDEFEICVFTTDSEFKSPHQMTQYNHKGARVYRSTVVWREHMDWYSDDSGMKELFSEFLLTEQPDLIHFHCIQRLGGSALEAAQEAGIPYIVTTHDAWWISDYQFLVDAENKVYPEGHPDPYEPYTPPSFVSLSDSIERILYLKDLLRNACEVLTVSESFADIYRKNEIPQIHVNKNGISESLHWRTKETRYTDKIVCGHVGGMAEHKGYFLLKNAVTKLQPKNIEMLIVDHSHEEGYRHETHWGDVPVTFIGRIAQTRVVDLYCQIDVLFAPSTWPESYGLVTREAAACGCWVVASSMGGIGEDVLEGESGFIVDPNLFALTDCLTKIDKEPAQFKGEAHTSVQRSVTEQVKELADIYRNRAVKND